MLFAAPAMQINFGNPPIFTFSQSDLARRAAGLRESFRKARPFPHVIIDDFLPVDVAERVLKYFPRPDAPYWLDWTKRDTVHQPKKQGIGHASRLEGAPPYLHSVLFAFNSSPFLKFLEELTGIERLLPDPHFHGGGLHQILSGGKLAMHADSTILEPLRLYRRLNVLVYLNKDWKPEYGGNLELWDRECSRCEASIEPLFNRMVLFETTRTSFHGHPKPLNTPANVTRKSMALYYFTSQPGEGEEYGHDIDWRET